MSFVFISYSHKDSDYAHRLADSLEAQGIDVWLDERVDYGSRWPRVIQEHLDHCGAFVLVMTPNSFDSEWVQNELAYAMSHRKAIFPLLLEGPVWLAVAASQVVPVSRATLPPKSFYGRLVATLSSVGESLPPSTNRRARLETELAELQRRYDNLTDRIRAVDTDLRRELDSERRLVLEERRTELVGLREKTAARMTRVETSLSAEPVVKPAPKPVQPTVQTALRAPRPSQRRRLRSDWLPVAAIAGAIAVIALIVNAAGLIPGARTPAATVPLVVGAEMTATVVPASTSVSTPANTSEPPTSTVSPVKVVLASDRARVIEPVGMELVRVPAGEFLMGSERTTDPEASRDEEPQHTVLLNEFYIGKYEVTNDQYAEFVRSAGIDAPSQWQNGVVPIGLEDHPVVAVSWNDAVAFTQWLSAWTGEPFRLCTEAEWEKACRGSDALIYPWSNMFDANRANTAEAELGATTAVGSYAPDGDSPYGVSDMAGNVWEWVADWYGEYTGSQAHNPLGPESGDARGLRGGSYDFDKERARCANRDQHPPYLSHGNDGFRVCVALPMSSPGQ